MDDDPTASTLYEIRLRGVLGQTLLSAFPAMRGTTRDGVTMLSGQLPDQAALFGVLGQVESLGLELLSVNHAFAPRDSRASSQRTDDGRHSVT